MRVFWAIVVLVMLLAAGTLLLARGGTRAQNGTTTPTVTGGLGEGLAGAKGPVVATPAPAAPPIAPSPAKPPIENASAHTTSSDSTTPAKTTDADDTPDSTHTTTTSTPTPPATEASKPAPPPASPPPVAQSPSPPVSPAPSPPTPTDTSSPFPADVDAKIVKQEDGSYLVDDKYSIRGRGTSSQPFEITWDYLISAQESYQPRLGKKKLPGRLTMLSGKEVKITGYMAFPVMAQEQTEMLMMLNQWDGCCIGVPPTAYDAIEVKLESPAVGMDRLATYGTVRGTLKVEPYLVKDWLVSLYAMDGARVAKEE